MREFSNEHCISTEIMGGLSKEVEENLKEIENFEEKVKGGGKGSSLIIGNVCPFYLFFKKLWRWVEMSKKEGFEVWAQQETLL